MEHTNELLVLNIPMTDQDEFIQSFRDAVLEVIMLLCERRELDLCEEQLYAISLLAHCAKSMEVMQIPAGPRIRR